ncbi:hypothetical protein Tco_1342674, partial [Tanacetum coccineum]
FNFLSVSQIFDKKHNVLFTDKECLTLSPKFKFVDEDLVILRAPRKNDVYSLDLKNIIPSGGITLSYGTEDWGIKGKQHRASCKKIEERTVREPLELLHMDLFGPVSVESVNRKKYCLVVTDDNVADLLTKGFDLARFNFLVVTIESLEALLLCLRGGYE